jgi:metal-sulfur cluster biosynthetic enzyme
MTSGTETDTAAGTDTTAATDTAVATDTAAATGAATGADAGTDLQRTAAALPEPPTPRADLAAIDDVEEAMRDVVDPELGINVVDLGLVYDLRVDEDNTAIIDMTLTSAACPLTDVIEEQARSALTGGPGGGVVNDIKINWVWMPPWGPEKITEDGREQLRALGFTV